MQANLTGQQYNALNTGYTNAMATAGSDLNRQLQAGQGLGNVATEQYNIGTGGLKTLADLGGQQQNLGQKQLDYPMLQAQNYAKLFPAQIPMGTTIQKTGPGTAGQYGLSPLQQIGGLAASLGSIMNGGTSSTGTGTGSASGFTSALGSSGLDANTINLIKSLGTQFGLFKKGGSVNLPDHIKQKLKLRRGN
jgi:hypothetical protein